MLLYQTVGHSFESPEVIKDCCKAVSIVESVKYIINMCY